MVFGSCIGWLFLCLPDVFFFFSSRRRHTRCALVTRVQTCALPIYGDAGIARRLVRRHVAAHPAGEGAVLEAARLEGRLAGVQRLEEIGRASCRERVCQYV